MALKILETTHEDLHQEAGGDGLLPPCQLQLHVYPRPQQQRPNRGEYGDNAEKDCGNDYERGILTSLVWLDFQWMDEYLKWNPADYEGITQIQLPPHKLWTPDIFLFNDVTGHFGDDLMRGRPYLVIENNGDVRWIPPMVLKTVCEHDNQEESCDLKFGSWVYSAGQLDLRPNIDTMDLEDYTGSTLWDLSETRVFRKETMYDCCVNPFVDITYTIRFHKKGKMSSMFKAKGWGL